MSVIGIAVAIISITAVGVLIALREKVKASERKKYYRAAHRIVREQDLEGAIKNGEQTGSRSERCRPMIVLKIKGNKEKGYVFDPSREINIGRSMEMNDLCLQELSVSASHCKIFMYDGRFCIKDMNSANGTILKSGWKKREVLYGTVGFLKNKSKIWVGSICLIATIFYYEMDF